MTAIKSILKKSPIYIILSLGAIVMVFPFLWMISSALKPNLYVIEYPPQFIPNRAIVGEFCPSLECKQLPAVFPQQRFRRHPRHTADNPLLFYGSLLFCPFQIPRSRDHFLHLTGCDDGP